MVRAYIGLGRNSLLFRHFRTLVAGTAVAQAVLLLTMPLVTRIFDPRDVGAWALYTGAVLTLGTVVGLRFDLGLFTSGDPRVQRQLFRASVVSLSVVSGLIQICGSILALLRPEFLGLGTTGWLLLGINIWLFAVFQLLQYQLNREDRFGEISRMRIEQAVCTVVLQILAGVAGAGGVALIVGTLVGHALPGWRFRALLAEHSRGASIRGLWSTLRVHWRMPVLNGAAAGIDAIRLNGINVLVASLYSSYWLGMYALAWRMVLAPSSLISTALGQIFISRFADTEGRERQRQVAKCLLISSSLGVLPFVALWAFGPRAFEIGFGREWTFAGQIASNLAPYLAMAFITAPLASIFVVTNRQAISLAFSVFYAAVPITALVLWPSDLLQATFWMGWSMAIILGLYLAVALVTAGQLDIDKPGPRGHVK